MLARLFARGAKVSPVWRWPSRAFCTEPANKTDKYLTQLEVTSLEGQPNELRNIIKSEIQYAGGEMKMHRYWSLALTHPTHGYYTSRNAFSKKGDFTTSPEISPLFGEMIGVWIVHFLQDKLNKKAGDGTANVPFRLLELGGGRGLLVADILRTLNNFKAVPKCISMIEASELQSRQQQKVVLDWFEKQGQFFKFSYELKNKEIFVGENNDTQLQWFKTLEEMMAHDMEAAKENPQQRLPMICISNEFFDALPVTPLVYSNGVWRERVVVLDENGRLALAVSKQAVPEKLAPATQPQEGTVLQVNYQGLMTMESLATLVEKHDGAILTIDYGNDFTHSDSIRAIRQHRYIETPKWVNLPGMCDLSAYVDFRALYTYVQKVPGMKAAKILPQGLFLQAMGIQARADILTATASLQKKERMVSECNRLIHPDQMGEIYKVQLATRQENIETYPFIDFQSKDNVF